MVDFHDPKNECERPLLSLCMIVRDCEETLGQALKSVGPFVDEMVVVDTGSFDKTHEVADENGAMLFDFVWCDDFSTSRNFSIECATGDWIFWIDSDIFWIDSDDVLAEESGRKLKEAIAGHPNRDAAFWVAVEQTTKQPDGSTRTTRHGHLKLFPRLSDIRFCYRVHEQVSPAIKKLGLPFKQSGAVVRHQNADRSDEGNRHRNQRNLRLLQLDLDEFPDDPFELMNLGMTYLHIPDGHQKTVEYIQRSLTVMTMGSPMRLNAYMVLASAYKHSQQFDVELRTCLQAKEEFPDDPVLLLRLAGLYRRRGELTRATDCYRESLQAKTGHFSVLHFPDTHIRAVVGLGEMYIQTGHRRRTETFWQDYLRKHPQAQAVHKALANSFMQTVSEST